MQIFSELNLKLNDYFVLEIQCNDLSVIFYIRFNKINFNLYYIMTYICNNISDFSWQFFVFLSMFERSIYSTSFYSFSFYNFQLSFFIVISLNYHRLGSYLSDNL